MYVYLPCTQNKGSARWSVVNIGFLVRDWFHGSTAASTYPPDLHQLYLQRIPSTKILSLHKLQLAFALEWWDGIVVDGCLAVKSCCQLA
jgi:hypothetical protein